MATYRVKKESGNFVTIHKGFITDDRLSAKAKGILLYLLSRPDDWQIYTLEVVKHMNDGQKSINSGINELIKVGYVERSRKRKDNGDFNGYDYVVYEKPKNIREMPFGENAKRENAKRINAKRENAKGHTTNINNTYKDLTNNYDTEINSSSSASTTKQQPPSHSYSNVFNFYQENGFGILQPFVVDQIDNWIKDFNGNENIVIEALKEAATNNVCKWSYANSILKSWYQDGIKSIDDIEARRKQREASKNKVQQSTKDTDDDWLNSPERQQYL
ncbi:DnaD domain protein [Staphylococcus hominis]|uniref:DnaD domain protein n=2 Tax=Staphylococcus hominis TaxID=1290 RepID=UPI0007D9F4BB|nr:DnaD domain protein [Staphylococcus hominis]MCI2848133.1 DnaD domain protein [Staphylococcus hominis]MCI2850388.1 DnaD domain protein [Staphylococcus hominis]MCI2856914.1 DnaD domain protein [Staphylococcus hominis]MDS3852801.1 DnaD domain protein [Staphylococcus hominis]MDS3888208.1 DnaD domain protein [Staphylococcus hominis]